MNRYTIFVISFVLLSISIVVVVAPWA